VGTPQRPEPRKGRLGTLRDFTADCGRLAAGVHHG
jgi:hypothetical protein